MEKRSFILEKGMGRTFAREWFNTNRALLIAEHQRRMDAQRTPLDRYMERVFSCADPSVVDRTSSKDRQMTLEELFMEVPSCAWLQQDLVAPAVEQRDAPPLETTPLPPKKKTKAISTPPAIAGSEQSVQAKARTPRSPTSSQELSELELAMGFCSDVGAFGTCKYATAVV